MSDSIRLWCLVLVFVLVLKGWEEEEEGVVLAAAAGCCA